jgi:hypothetical protein
MRQLKGTKNGNTTNTANTPMLGAHKPEALPVEKVCTHLMHTPQHDSIFLPHTQLQSPNTSKSPNAITVSTHTHTATHPETSSCAPL